MECVKIITQALPSFTRTYNLQLVYKRKESVLMSKTVICLVSVYVRG